MFRATLPSRFALQGRFERRAVDRYTVAGTSFLKR